MDRDIVEKLCLYLLNKGFKKLKKEMEFLNADGTLDVYGTVDAIFADPDDVPDKKAEFLFKELKLQFGEKFPVLFERAETAAGNKNSFRKAA